MTFSHWGKTIIEEKHQAVMRWVTTTVEETDSKVALQRLLETDVLTPQVAKFLVFELKGNSAPETNIYELQLSLDLISKHLLTAYEKTYSYLLTPETFLADFLASIEGAAFDESFSNKLEVFVTYDYFPMILAAWATYLKQQGTGFVSRTELVVKIHEIDQLILRHATISVMVDLLDPIYDFHRHHAGNPTLPGSELALLFEDKNLSQAAQEFNLRSDKYFNLREAVEIISNMLGTGFIPSEIPPPPEVPVSSEYPETHYDAFLQDLQEAGVELRTPDETQKAVPSIELFIGKKLRERTIRKVFHDNRNEYQRFITFLNASSSLDKALLNLETTLRMQRVDPTSKLAQRLRDAAMLRFRQYSP
jgi:hypothetical protein